MADISMDRTLCDVAEAYRRADWEACRQLLRDALVKRPDDGACLQWQGLVWHAQGAFAAARRVLEYASLLVPLSVPSQVALAEAYQHCGRRDDALTILRFLAECEDLPTNCLPRLSAALGKLGEVALALDVCREASLRDADDDEACFGMAYFMNKLGYPTECVMPLLRRALALEPERPVYRLSVGVMCAGPACSTKRTSCFAASIRTASPARAACKRWPACLNKSAMSPGTTPYWPKPCDCREVRKPPRRRRPSRCKSAAVTTIRRPVRDAHRSFAAAALRDRGFDGRRLRAAAGVFRRRSARVRRPPQPADLTKLAAQRLDQLRLLAALHERRASQSRR
ncbi:MAG: hypothetical protein QM775_19800 [Pirellulales bacterium]